MATDRSHPRGKRQLSTLEPLLTSDEAGLADVAFDILRGTLMLERLRYDHDDIERILAILDGAASKEEALGLSLRAASRRYMMFNTLRGQASWRESIDALDEVARLNPRYLGRGYFWRERGGSFYELGDYEAAAECYSRSIELDGPPEGHYLLSDALLDAGQYQRAAEVAREGPANLHRAYATSLVIHMRRIATVVRILGIERQERRPATAALVESLSPEFADRDAIIEGLRATDGLDHRLWTALAVRELARGAPEDAMDAFLVAAKTVPNDPVLWASALCSGIDASASDHLLDAICDEGMRFADGAAALLSSLEYLELQSDDPLFRAATDRISARSEHLPAPMPRTLRDIRADGSFVEYDLT